MKYLFILLALTGCIKQGKTEKYFRTDSFDCKRMSDNFTLHECRFVSSSGEFNITTVYNATNIRVIER